MLKIDGFGMDNGISNNNSSSNSDSNNNDGGIAPPPPLPKEMPRNASVENFWLVLCTPYSSV